MNNLNLFTFGVNPVRVVDGPDGGPWFVAKDVAALLGYQVPKDAVGRVS